MKPSRAPRLLMLALAAAIVAAPVCAFSQVRVLPPTSRGNPDPLATMLAGAASFDMDSPVEVHAEFDPAEVTVGAKVTFRLTMTALNESLKVPEDLPVPAGLTLKPGGRGQIYENSGGTKVRPQTTVIYHGVATTNGTLTVPAFEVLAYGKPITVPETKLKVTEQKNSDADETPRLLVNLPPGDIYAGQTLRIPLILPINTPGSVMSLSQPRITGEFVFSEMAPVAMRQENMQRNGKAFLAFIQEVLLTPLREGEQEIVAQAYCNVVRPVPGQSNAFQAVMILVDSEPIKLVAKAAPLEGRLPGFTGAIGNFQIDPPRISTNEVRAGEPIMLGITIRGDGNVGRLTPPSPPLLRDWQTFPPIGENLPASIIQQRGFANFAYTLIPLNDQSKSTPAIPFCYFDPKKKVYVDLTIPPVHLTVKPSPAGAQALAQASGNVIPATEGEPNPEKELVLSGLAESPGLAVASMTPIQQRWWFVALQLAPALALAALCAWDRRRRHLELHPEVVLKRRARRRLRRELRLARSAAARQDAEGFVSGATNALREACAPSGAANPSALVCADVLLELPEPERESDAGNLVRRLFAAADALRFGGAVKDGPALISMRPQFEQVLNQLRARL